MIVTFSWADESDQRYDWAQALRVRDGRIVDMQDYRSPRHATASARLRAALG